MGFKKLKYILDGNLSVFSDDQNIIHNNNNQQKQIFSILNEVYQFSSLKQSEYFGI